MMQSQTHQQSSGRPQQSGAALIVGLVLMMVLTVLAVSTMRTATLELAMSGNAQYREKARQLAETGVAIAMNRFNDSNDPLGDQLIATNEGDLTVGIVNGELEPGSGNTYSVDLRFLYTGDPPSGTSQNLQATQAHYFELQSTGSTMARNARSVVVQGLWIRAD